MKKCAIRLCCTLFLVIVVQILPAKDKLEGGLILSSDSDNEIEELLELEGRIIYIMDLPKNMEACIGIEVDQFELNPHEISLRFGSGDRFLVRVGYEKNAMTLEEFRRSFLRIITTSSTGTAYFRFQGYVARNIGFRIYRNHDSNSSRFPLSWWSKLSMSLPNVYEPQIEGGVHYHFAGEESYLSLFAVYLPFFVHSLVNETDDLLDNYFAFTFCIADLKGPFLYQTEFAFGSNMKDPLGMLPVPPGEDPGYFFYANGLIGWEFPVKNEMIFRTAMQYSHLIPDISKTNYKQQEFVWGNQLYISNEFKVFMDTGVKYISSHGLLDPDEEWNWVWRLGVQISTRGINLDTLLSRYSKTEQ